MENLTIDKVLEYLQGIRKGLVITLVVIIGCLFARTCLNDIKYDVTYLEERFSKIMNDLENKSLLDPKLIVERDQIEFREWSDKQMELIQREIEKLHDNVKSVKIHKKFKDEGLTRYDLALASSGGRVASVHDTQLLDYCSPIRVLLGACHRRNPPEKVLQSSNEPGQCFCFKGSEGAFTIRMSYEAVLDGATLEHIPRSLSPTNDISSAPKKFRLTGMQKIDDEHGIDFGTFEFDPTVIPKQVYTLQNKSYEKIRYVRVDILENHGDESQTCLYRLQLHGFVEK